MNVEDIPSSGSATVACGCGNQLVVVDRYVTDFPPIPRGRNPESFVEFYRDRGYDPDDRILQCPACGEDLELSSVHLITEGKDQ